MSLLEMTVDERELKELLKLSRAGEEPTVKWSPSKADMDAEAFRRRGEVLSQISARLVKLLGSDDPNGKDGEG